jgi:hypothetical protein
MELLILILVVLLFFGGIGVAPRWGYSSQWGWGPSGFAFVLVIVLLVLLLFTSGRVHAANGISPLAWQCARLYKARNDFYNLNGMCFTRRSAKEFYPENEMTCTIKHSRDFPISFSEKQAIDAIVAQERALGCPRL